MQKIKTLLSTVYSEEQVEHILSEIDVMISNYSQENAPAKGLDHTDVALITYGDQVLKEKLPPLQSLSEFVKEYLASAISIVHVLPFYPYSSDDGFSVIDYKAVNPEWGNWDDMKALSTDFRLMFDAVINHMSAQSEWFQKYLLDDPQFKDFFVDGSQFKDLSKVVRPRTSPLVHDFNGKKVWTTFSRDQVDLNYANPDLFLRILDVLCYYAEQGGTIIRLDAIGFMWKADSTTCIHLDETHNLIKAMRAVLEIVYPEIILISETNVPHAENVSYFGNGDEAHMVYNFALPPLVAFSLLSGDASKLKKWVSNLEIPGGESCFFNFLASHDGVGLRPVQDILDENEIEMITASAASNGGRISYRSAGGVDKPYEVNCNYFSLLKGKEQNEQLGIKRMLLAHAVLLSLPGLPAIYFHSLLGSQNDLQGLERLGYPRAVNREKLYYEELENELADTGNRRYAIFSEIKRMIKVRKKLPQFDPYGSFEPIQTNDSLLAFIRPGKTGDLLCYFNFSDQHQSIRLEGSYINQLSGNTISDDVELRPYEYIWLVKP
ncbi:MAG: alpha-amylase family glycosyl hydrolase [Cyclobacteriaceae bacterium]